MKSRFTQRASALSSSTESAASWPMRIVDCTWRMSLAREELAVGLRPRAAGGGLEDHLGDGPVLVGRERGANDAILRLDDVVGDDEDVEQPVHAVHQRVLELGPDRPAGGPVLWAGHAAAVGVGAARAAVAELHRERLQRRPEADVLHAAAPGELDARRGGGALRGVGVPVEQADHEVEV
jgi:hypothetical protein